MTDAISVTSMPPADVATLLRRAGAPSATEEAVLADLAAGAPQNPDGTVNFLAYAAWQERRLAERGD